MLYIYTVYIQYIVLIPNNISLSYRYTEISVNNIYIKKSKYT